MNFLERAWYGKQRWPHALKPLSKVFTLLSDQRRQAYALGNKEIWNAPVPVVVVGNISVGGVGKTPLVAALTEFFLRCNFKPGIVSRGYGAKPPSVPFSVTVDSLPEHAGDEPLLLARRTKCPVVTDPDRVAAAKYLLHAFDCDIIISDDGLQHYALGRDVEIAVVDGERGLGNGLCLPAGPLREPPERLQEVDWVVINGQGRGGLIGGLKLRRDMQNMRIEPLSLVNLHSGRELSLQQDTLTKQVHALAGIGHPDRFFATLESLGFEVQPHVFPDHHAFTADDLPRGDTKAIIMTEKDAVKCSAIADERCWYLKVTAQLDARFLMSLAAAIHRTGKTAGQPGELETDGL